MPTDFSNSDLEAYLDESLPVERMTAIEDALRENSALQKRLTAINGRRDAGVHSLGDLAAASAELPTREQLGSYLLGVLSRDAADYAKFHLEAIGCRYCLASLPSHLKAQQSAADADIAERRRQKYFQSSAGYLRKK